MLRQTARKKTIRRSLQHRKKISPGFVPEYAELRMLLILVAVLIVLMFPRAQRLTASWHGKSTVPGGPLFAGPGTRFTNTTCIESLTLYYHDPRQRSCTISSIISVQMQSWPLRIEAQAFDALFSTFLNCDIVIDIPPCQLNPVSQDPIQDQSISYKTPSAVSIPIALHRLI